MTAATTTSARNSKGIETEGRSPEELRELVSHWGAELELAPAEDIIEWAAATFGERFCVTSSMGDAALAHDTPSSTRSPRSAASSARATQEAKVSPSSRSSSQALTTAAM